MWRGIPLANLTATFPLPHLNLLNATLTEPPVCIASTRLTENLTPLDSALTEIRGEGDRC